MSKLLATKPYDVHSFERDAVVLRDYTNDNSSIAFKRTAAKRTKDFPGMSKSETKYTLTDISGSLIGIVSVSTSIRADATSISKSDLLDTTRAVVADASWTDLVTDHRLPIAV